MLKVNDQSVIILNDAPDLRYQLPDEQIVDSDFYSPHIKYIFNCDILWHIGIRFMFISLVYLSKLKGKKLEKLYKQYNYSLTQIPMKKSRNYLLWPIKTISVDFPGTDFYICSVS